MPFAVFASQSIRSINGVVNCGDADTPKLLWQGMHWLVG